MKSQLLTHARIVTAQQLGTQWEPSAKTRHK